MKRISVFALTLLLIASLIGIVTVSADTQKGVTAVGNLTANDVAVEFDVGFAEKLSEETAHYITTADVYNEWYVAASGVQDVAKAQAIRSGLGEQVRNNVFINGVSLGTFSDELAVSELADIRVSVIAPNTLHFVFNYTWLQSRLLMLDKNGNFTQGFTLRICKDFQVEGQTVMENDYVNTYDPSTGTWTEGEPQSFIFGKVSDLGRGTISLLGSQENAYRFEIKFSEKIADRAYQLINVGVNNAEAWIAYCGVDGMQLGDENSVGTAKYILSHLAESVRGIKIEGKSIAEHLEIAGTIEDFGGFGSTLGIVVNVTEDLKGLEFLLSDLYAASDKGFVSGSEKYEVLISSFVGLSSEGKADISLGCPINIECDGATGKWINLYAPAAESIEIIEVKPLQEAGALLEFEVKFNQNLTTEKYEYLTTRIDLAPNMLAWFVGANANIADAVKGQGVFDRLGVQLLDKISVNGITVGQMSLDIITISKDMEDAIGAETGSIGPNAVNVSVERDILKVSISKEVAQYYGIALNSDGAVMFSAALKIDAGISSYLDSNCILENGGKYIVSQDAAVIGDEKSTIVTGVSAQDGVDNVLTGVKSSMLRFEIKFDREIAAKNYYFIATDPALKEDFIYYNGLFGVTVDESEAEGVLNGISKEVLDKITFKGKTISELCQLAKELDMYALYSGRVEFFVNVTADKMGLELYIDKPAARALGLISEADGILQGKYTIAIPQGFHFSDNAELASDFVATLNAEDGSFELGETDEGTDPQFGELNVVSVSAPMDDGTGSIKFQIKFDNDVASRAMVHLNGGYDWLYAVSHSANPAFTYSDEELNTLRDWGVLDSALNKIRINGMSIQEYMERENGEGGTPAVYPVSMMVHFGNDSSDTVTVVFASNGINKTTVDAFKEGNTFEILSGFTTATGLRLKQDVKFIMNAKGQWILEGTESGGSSYEPDGPWPNIYLPEIIGGSIGGGLLLIAIGVSIPFIIKAVKKKKNIKGNEK